MAIKDEEGMATLVQKWKDLEIAQSNTKSILQHLRNKIQILKDDVNYMSTSSVEEKSFVDSNDSLAQTALQNMPPDPDVPQQSESKSAFKKFFGGK